jgi:hypothetical protein
MKRNRSQRKETKDKDRAPVQIHPALEHHQIHLLPTQMIQNKKGTETEKTEILVESARETGDPSQKQKEKELIPGKNQEKSRKRIQESSQERKKTRERNPGMIRDMILVMSHVTNVATQGMRTETDKGGKASTKEAAVGTTRVTEDDDFINLTNDSLRS